MEIVNKLRKYKNIPKTTENPVFIVNPFNDIHQAILRFENCSDFIKKSNLVMKNESIFVPRIIKLIKCESQKVDEITEEIDERGFIPAPTPYVLGLVEHFHLLNRYHLITSIDKSNLFINKKDNESFLGLIWLGYSSLQLIEKNNNFIEKWWFAVIKKDVIFV